MDVPPDALVELTLDPASYTLELEPGATVAGALVRRSDGRSMVRFRQRADWREVELEVDEPSLTLSDAVYLVSVALFTEHHRDAYLMRGGALGFVEPTRRRLSVPHPPRMESVEAMLSELPPRTRIELLVEACELGVPIWTRWASTGKLTYFDGIMAMASVPHDLAEASIRAARRWLEDGDGAPLEALSSEYWGLHWPMLED
ncbi:MAG: hypothetical protein H6719_37710, partial [Sandaracinaceae bacterium]|nr:hypothetical protein [Sandaracinaceae bacterium]